MLGGEIDLHEDVALDRGVSGHGEQVGLEPLTATRGVLVLAPALGFSFQLEQLEVTFVGGLKDLDGRLRDGEGVRGEPRRGFDVAAPRLASPEASEQPFAGGGKLLDVGGAASDRAADSSRQPCDEATIFESVQHANRGAGSGACRDVIPEPQPLDLPRRQQTKLLEVFEDQEVPLREHLQQIAD